MIIEKRNEINGKFSGEFYEKIASKEFMSNLVINHGALSNQNYDKKFIEGLGDRLLIQLLPINNVLKGNLYKKRILDIGAGARSNTYETTEWNSRDWEPWLCRALYNLEANPIGIDIGNLEGEKFEHYSIDLLSPNSLDFISDNSIDVAHAELLYDSPTLEQMHKCGNLRDYLIPQLERIVKPEGYFIEGL